MSAEVLRVYLEREGVKQFTAHELLNLGNSHYNRKSKAFGKNELCPLKFYGNLAKIAKKADGLRMECKQPLVVLSAYRSLSYNSALSGSASKSRHLTAEALDIAPTETSVQVFHSQVRVWRQGFSGGVGFYPWGVHIDLGASRTWGKALG